MYDMKALRLIIPTLAFATAITLQGQQGSNSTQLEAHSSVNSALHDVTGHVERTTKAINYAKRSDITTVAIRGTTLLPAARGEAKIQSKQDHVEVVADFNGLEGAMRFGPEYLTYVMWAIGLDGCATNLGEVVLNDAKGKLSVTTKLAVFGLVVTAEPYFAVSEPSDAVVMENVVPTDSVRQIEGGDVKYELLPRGTYTLNVSPSEVKPIVLDPNTPFELFEARNALWIALWAGADKDAAELFASAERLLQKAEAFHASRAEEVRVSTAARESVRIAENARLIALKHRSENQVG